MRKLSVGSIFHLYGWPGLLNRGLRPFRPETIRNTLSSHDLLSPLKQPFQHLKPTILWRHFFARSGSALPVSGHFSASRHSSKNAWVGWEFGWRHAACTKGNFRGRGIGMATRWSSTLSSSRQLSVGVPRPHLGSAEAVNLHPFGGIGSPAPGLQRRFP